MGVDMKHDKDLKKLLNHYDKFMRTARKRIISSHKKYGDDWTRKDNMKEAEYELYDLANYAALTFAQLEERCLSKK